MNHQRFHIIEKFQIQMTTLLAGVIVFFLFWPVMKPADILKPAVYLATGQTGKLLILAGGVWVLSAVLAAITIHVRPMGALVATALGTGALSIHSARIESLLWEHEGSIGSTYFSMMAEVLILAVILAVTAVIVVLVRRAIGKAYPKLLWKNPIEGAEQAKSDKGITSIFIYLSSWRGEAWNKSETLINSLKCLGLALVTAEIMMLILMRSPLRGQILFSLAGSFLVAMIIANHYSPTPLGLAVCFVPVVCAMIHYFLGASGMLLDSDSCANIQKALPIDWMTMGLGGALTGYWVSQRLREMKLLEQQASQE